jgi:DNA-binding transcriptional LysR family regulator
MHRDENWDDLRFVLAVAETGALSRAAARLGVNHATVLRRIGAFEARIGLRIFDRTPKGYSLTDTGARLLPALSGVETAIEALERIASGADTTMRGIVRLTSTDTFTTTVLPRIAHAFTQSHPGITIELLTTSLHVSLSRLDADMAVRPAYALPRDMVGVEAAILGFAVYGRRDVVDRARLSPEAAPWLDVSPSLRDAPPGRWMTEQRVPPGQVVATADSFVTMRAMALAGAGLALLPCILGDEAEGLVRRDRGEVLLRVPIWVACHVDMAGVQRLLAARAHVADALGAASGRLLGER